MKIRRASTVDLYSLHALRRFVAPYKELSGEQGANLVEMALVTMFLMLLLALTVDIGGAFQSYSIITNAAREGARTAARLPCKSDNRNALRTAIINSVLNEVTGTSVVLAAENVTITPDPVAVGCATPGEPVQVAVTIQYTTIFGQVLGVAQFPVSNSASMAFTGND